MSLIGTSSIFNIELLLLVGFCLYSLENIHHAWFCPTNILINMPISKKEVYLLEAAFSSALKNGCDQEASDVIISVLLWTLQLYGSCHTVPGLMES